jgi:hypothetical protein
MTMLPKTMADPWQILGKDFDMHKLTVLLAMTLLTVSSVSAQSRKIVQQQRHGAAFTATQELSPEAAAMRDAQRTWPGRPLCDDGGYRIRPCGLGAGGGGGS